MHRVQLIHTPVSYIFHTILRTHTMKIKFAAISPRIFKGIVNISVSCTWRRTAKRYNLGIMKATSFRHWHLFPRPALQLRASMIKHCANQIKKQKIHHALAKLPITYDSTYSCPSPCDTWCFYTSWRLMSKSKHSYARRPIFASPAMRYNELWSHTVDPTFCLSTHARKCLSVARQCLNPYKT